MNKQNAFYYATGLAGVAALSLAAYLSNRLTLSSWRLTILAYLIGTLGVAMFFIGTVHNASTSSSMLKPGVSGSQRIFVSTIFSLMALVCLVGFGFSGYLLATGLQSYSGPCTIAYVYQQAGGSQPGHNNYYVNINSNKSLKINRGQYAALAGSQTVNTSAPNGQLNCAHNETISYLPILGVVDIK